MGRSGINRLAPLDAELLKAGRCLRRGVFMARVDRALVSGARSFRVTPLGKQVSEVDRGPWRPLNVPRFNGPRVGGARSLRVAPLDKQHPEAVGRHRRLLAI